MLRIDREQKRLYSFRQLTPHALPPVGELTELIANSGDEFFGEIGERLLLLPEALWLAQTAEIRVDLLGIDPRGRVVSILLCGSGQPVPLARAIASVGVAATWRPETILEASTASGIGLQSFLEVPLEDVNRKQRIVLIADTFDEAVTAATKWLRERGGLEVRCLSAALGADSWGSEYLTLTEVSKGPSVPELPGPGDNAQLDTPALAAGNGSPQVDRRRQLRIRKYGAQHLTLDYQGQILALTNVIDLSERGLGGETLDPLPIGSSVTVAGDMHTSASALKLEGRARVAHCQGRDGRFRIGLAFDELRCEPVE